MRKLKKVLIIAEAGVNHNGSLKRALKLVDVCKKIGADIIKFQTWKTEKVVTKNSPKADYQKKFFKKKTQFESLKKLELSFDDFKNGFHAESMAELVPYLEMLLCRRK